MQPKTKSINPHLVFFRRSENTGPFRSHHPMFCPQCWSLPCDTPSRLCVTPISRQRFPVSIGVNIVGGDVGRSWFCILGNTLGNTIGDLSGCDWIWVCGWHPNGPGSPCFLRFFCVLCIVTAPFSRCWRVLGTFCFATFALSLSFLCYGRFCLCCQCFLSPRCSDAGCSFPFRFHWFPPILIIVLIFPNFLCNSLGDLGLSSPGLGLFRKIWWRCSSDMFLYFFNKAWLSWGWIFVVCRFCFVHCFGFFHVYGRADLLFTWATLKFWSFDISSSRFNCWLSIRKII